MTSKTKWKMTMTEILIGSNPGNPQVVGAIKTEPKTEEKATQLPTPTGYNILCAIPDIEEKFDSGLIKADVTLKNEEVLATVLFVIALGPDCYKDKAKFPTGPWCKEGDFVVVRRSSGSRLDIHGREFRLIHDDTPIAVVEDPRGIKSK
jgi:co-chaperonin GroES (HSP10)